MSVHVSPRTLLDRSMSRTALVVPVRAGVVALGVALTALAAQFTAVVPLTAVPFALTPMAVLLTGAALGSRLGALTQTLYVLLGAAGAAVFVPSVVLPAGMLRLIGPTGGYLLAYPLAAFVTGRLSERGWDRRYSTSLAAMIAGLAVIYLGGAAWLIAAHGASVAVAVTTGILPFVFADLLKAVAAALVLPQAWRLLKSQ